MIHSKAIQRTKHILDIDQSNGGFKNSSELGWIQARARSRSTIAPIYEFFFQAELAHAATLACWVMAPPLDQSHTLCNNTNTLFTIHSNHHIGKIDIRKEQVCDPREMHASPSTANLLSSPRIVFQSPQGVPE